MNLHWPQILIIVLTASGLVMTAKKHGTSEILRVGPGALILIAGFFVLTYTMGGFFDTMELPQLVMIIVLAMTFTNTAMSLGKAFTYNIYRSIAASSLNQGLLIIGGFYGSVI